MATIHVFRHAQGMHDKGPELKDTRDPDLSEEGRKQCAELAVSFPHTDKITHLVSSPMRRAINSCLLAFPTVVSKQKITLLPELTEEGSQMSDFGSDISVLLKDFGEGVDANGVPGHWNKLTPTSRSAYNLEKIEGRTTAGREWLADLAFFSPQGSHIVVMTHGHTAHWLTDDFEGVEAPGYLYDWDGELAYRSYQFDFASKKMIETSESRARRGAPAASVYDEAAKRNVKEVLRGRILKRMPEVYEFYDAHN
ncbi:phosphoglycerate mutase-like protein [Xylariaceae sp. FL0662B]|nr:phosphoglycerate mutase-like protein [Xylariaceae sp. FL0662B]